MHTFTDKSKATQQTTSTRSTTPSRPHFGQSPEMRSIPRLQSTIGNQALQRMMQIHAEEPMPRFGHDFSGIPVQASVPRDVQTIQNGSGAADPLINEGEESVGGQKEPPKPESAAPKPDAKPEPAPKPEPKPAEARKPDKPTITHETTSKAPDGTDKKRTDVGVGEEVTFTGSAVGKWTASQGKPTELASGDTFIWTAPDRAATVTIKLQVGTEQETVSMKVIEPESITAHKNSEMLIGAGTAGLG